MDNFINEMKCKKKKIEIVKHLKKTKNNTENQLVLFIVSILSPKPVCLTVPSGVQGNWIRRFISLFTFGTQPAGIYNCQWEY